MGTQKQSGGAETEADKVRDQQHTGNHDRAPGEDPDRFGGTRAGAQNVEPAPKGAAKKR